jgi:hypothetical protein
MYPILNRESDSILNEYFEGAVHDLDEAGGTHVEVLGIGDPGKSGPNHRLLRNRQLQKAEARDAETFVEQYHRTGRVQYHRLGEMKGYQRELAIPPEDLPCLVFMTKTSKQPIGMLRIRPLWYSSRATINAFDRCLRAWFVRDDLKQMAMASHDDSALARAIEPLLENLAESIDTEIGSELPGVATGGSAASVNTEENSFRYDGEHWRIVWEKVELPRIQNLAGLRVIHYLLRNESREFQIFDLLNETLDKGLRSAEPDTARSMVDDLPVLSRPDAPFPRGDATARKLLLAEYQRMREIKESLEEAGGSASTDLEGDLHKIVQQLARDYDSGGKPRLEQPARHRAQSRLNKTIKKAYERIGRHSPDLRAHLEASISWVGGNYCYRPRPRVEWNL